MKKLELNNWHETCRRGARGKLTTGSKKWRLGDITKEITEIISHG